MKATLAAFGFILLASQAHARSPIISYTAIQCAPENGLTNVSIDEDGMGNAALIVTTTTGGREKITTLPIKNSNLVNVKSGVSDTLIASKTGPQLGAYENAALIRLIPLKQDKTKMKAILSFAGNVHVMQCQLVNQ